MNKTMLAVRLPVDIEERLTALAKKTGRTKTYYVTEAIMRHIEDIEDYYIGEKALQEFENGDQKTYTSDEIIAELGL